MSLTGWLWRLIHHLWNALGFLVLQDYCMINKLFSWLYYLIVTFDEQTDFACWARNVPPATCQVWHAFTQLEISAASPMAGSWWLCGVWLRRGRGRGFGFQRFPQQRQRLAMQPCLRHWASSRRPGSLAAHDLSFAKISGLLLQSQDSESSSKVLEEISSRDSVLAKGAFLKWIKMKWNYAFFWKYVSFNKLWNKL